MKIKQLAAVLLFVVYSALFLNAQQATSGDVTVRLSEPIDFATGRPLQAVRAVVVSSTNPSISAGGPAVLQLQNRDGSYTLKLLRLVVGGQMLRTMSQPGVSVSGGPASGQHASLTAGATVKFTLTNADGTPGAPMQPTTVAPAAIAPATAASADNSQKDEAVALLHSANNKPVGGKLTQAESAQMFKLIQSGDPTVSGIALFIQDNIATELDSTWKTKAARTAEDALRKRCVTDLIDQIAGAGFAPESSKSCAKLKSDMEPSD